MEYTPNEIAIFHRDNDQQNHWVQWGLAYFQTNPQEQAAGWRHKQDRGSGAAKCLVQSLNRQSQWIGLRENLQEKPNI